MYVVAASWFAPALSNLTIGIIGSVATASAPAPPPRIDQ